MTVRSSQAGMVAPGLIKTSSDTNFFNNRNQSGDINGYAMANQESGQKEGFFKTSIQHVRRDRPSTAKRPV
jgi:hypothetical protein